MSLSRAKKVRLPGKAKLDYSNNLNGTLFPPDSRWIIPTSFPNLSDAELIGVDVETKDPYLTTQGPGFIRGDAEIVGVTLATEERGWYFPVRHLGGGNLDPDIVFEYVRDIMRKPIPKVMANVSYDLEALWSEDIEVKGPVYDVQIAQALLTEDREEGFDLGSLGLLHLGESKDEALLTEAASAYNVPVKGGLWKLPSHYVGAYGEWDGVAACRILKKQLPLLEKEDLMRVFDLETRVTPVLHKMRIQGVPFDIERANSLNKRLAIQEVELLDEMVREHNEHINVNSFVELAQACDRLKIPYNRSESGNPSFAGKWLESHEHPFMQLVVSIRQLQKMKNDFVVKLMKQAIRGRLYSQWVQIGTDEGGTKSGRFACKNPNNQQVPAAKRRNGKPNPIGAEIRACYTSVPDGAEWFKNDYKQQEPRILVHFAELCKYAGADAAAMAYRCNPKADFYEFVMQIANVNKRRAKDIYLSICYNQGLPAFAGSINLPEHEAQEVLDTFNSALPFIRQISDRCTELAKNRGFVKTLYGRRRHYRLFELTSKWKIRKEMLAQGKSLSEIDYYLKPRLEKEAKEFWPNKHIVRAYTHTGLNAVIQGSAADMMKAGLVKGWEEDKRVPYLSVHDEVDGPVSGEEDAKKWQRTMETCVDLNVPILGDMSIGKHWK